MARKKKGTKKVHRKGRRKMSGTAEIEQFIMRSVGVGLGAIAGAYIIQAGNTALGAQTANMPWLIPAGVALVGAVAPLIDKKNAIVEDFGMGLLATGAVMAANQFGLNVPGISGLAMSNNAPMGTSSLSRAVGRRVGAGPSGYLSKTVGCRTDDKLYAVGALISN